VTKEVYMLHDHSRVNVRLSEAEATILAELAREADRSASSVVRVLIKQAATRPDLRAALAQ
jgi:hypothetical protein